MEREFRVDRCSRQRRLISVNPDFEEKSKLV